MGLLIWVDKHAWSLALKRYHFHVGYFGTDEDFYAVINVPLYPDFKEWILEREFSDIYFTVILEKDICESKCIEFEL